MSDALVPHLRRPRPPHARVMRLGNEAPAVPFGFRPRPEAALLLSQVLARVRGVELPAIQFVQATAGDEGARVARGFAEACAARLGRTLLITLLADSGMMQEAGGSTEVLRRPRKAGGEMPDIVPDSALPGLYHARVVRELDDALAVAQRPAAAWLGRGKLDFRMLVVDCGPIQVCAAALDFAARCDGTVLSVAAGSASLAQIQSTARQVQLAGGTVLGSVLYDAPKGPVSMFRWRSKGHD